MPAGSKIATCCYCGTRAVLTLGGVVRHELSCSACGAPLRNLKMLRTDKAADTGSMPKRSAGRPAPVRGAWAGATGPARPRKSKSKKRRKGVMSKLLEEAFDVLEDIFD